MLLPLTHVFEGMRETLRTGRVNLGHMDAAFGFNLLALVLGAAFFGWMLRRWEKGYPARLGME